MSFLSEFKYKKGFTLLEFLVSISIGVVILATVTMGQSRYNDLASLKSVANDISLNIRQAQVYGISVREKTAGSEDFSGSYGVSFNVSYPTSYVYFIDKSLPSGSYDAISFTTCVGPSQECMLINQITRGNRLANPMCRIAILNDVETCDVGRADITFVRPNTEARIAYFNSSGGWIDPTGTKGLKIKLISPQGREKSVVVYSSGHISVQ